MGLCSPGREFLNLGEMMHGFDAASQPRRNDAWFLKLLPNLGEVA